jgi:hypothetical protein
MTMLERPSRERPPRTRRTRTRSRSRETAARVLIGTLLLVFVFLLGIAFSRTLDERPEPGGVVTDVRTLTPLPQQPPARTVTVTVTSP